MDGTVYSVYFSPAGTTKQVTERAAAGFPGERRAVALLEQPLKEELRLGENDLLVVGIPVYAGRVPAVCAERLRKWKGSGTPAVALAVYGNRDYDDALLELKDLLEENGFIVIGAAAFVAQHSIFPQVGKGRPDASDLEKIDTFAAQCARKWAQGRAHWEALAVRGNRPYKTPGAVPVKPSANGDCNGCGACARICPVQAISPKNPRKTDKDNCISCAACIRVCPQHARDFRGPVYKAAALAFYQKCAARREPEWFI
ncbi:EFR1 family ferrodoxin [Clostridium sp. D33t1_170424_F3]|uniref:EFR1 family ferrodoxin n=1 Tax=Clostridium sp. D33t1_170424_F3 TaxID=2787099 RepID=UPI0018AC7ECC|nr:EFR1 family ferrodoxin [Clostridium sp. D33t1_170424_F3]